MGDGYAQSSFNHGRLETSVHVCMAGGNSAEDPETGEDVNLYIFNSTGNWSRDAGYNRAEYNIYNLPELSDFDGIIGIK